MYSAELENLQKLLHFPEEVAIKLTQTEHALFCKVRYLLHLFEECFQNGNWGKVEQAKVCLANGKCTKTQKYSD